MVPPSLRPHRLEVQAMGSGVWCDSPLFLCIIVTSEGYTKHFCFVFDLVQNLSDVFDPVRKTV